MQRSANRMWMIGVAGLAAGLGMIAGCSVGPRYRAPAPPTVTAYTPQPLPAETASSQGPSGNAQHFNSSAAIPADWWTTFQSPELNAMVEQALKNSPTLEQATARLKQAQEEVNARTGSTKYPAMTGNASVTEEQLNLAALGVPFPNPSPFALLNGSMAVSYALDVFGANRRAIEGLKAQRDYEAWQIKGARLMLEGNVVAAAIRQAEVRREIEITRQLVAVEQKELKILKKRERAGGVSDFDVHSQLTQVAQTEAAIPPLELQLDTIDDQLAALMGLSPAEAEVAGISLDALHLPEELPMTVPSELVRQRPDIRAAEALLHEASANVGVATANQYPQIVLTGSGGGLGTRFNSGGDVWNVGASLAAPIFNGGALQAEKRKAEDAYDEAASAYRATVLESFREVADALYATEHDAEALQARSVAAGEAEAAYGIAAKRYEAGGISEMSLLDAERQKLQTALDRENAASSRLTDSATLFEALGGSAKGSF
jgi:NodT family efflux transporter outer membrane factor (OMF) lipoprotein